ncbi:PQQ-binding-like beta-propeller repeat protein [Streptomyces sp. NPDC006798]|uniref:caspase, EACC1-associated type n=1 Tax=Streptomyces sp. NPDC006798 TaxID=3155462 RepID=UPI0033EA116F
MTTAAVSDPAASRAVLVGTHDYRHLPRLPAVERSTAALSEVLGHPRVWGLPAAHRTLLPQPADARTVIDALEEAAGAATDTLLVYYAGHGLIDRHNNELVLTLPGTRPDRPDTGLRYEYVRRAVLDARVTARRKVVVLDCCYSGLAMSGEMASAPLGSRIADHALIEGTFLLTATAETVKALAPPGEPYTAFTGELITVLATGVEDGPAQLDMETVYRETHRRLTARGRPAPQQRNRNFGARIALAHNTAVPPGAADGALTALVAPRTPAGRGSPTARRALIAAAGALALGGAGGVSWRLLAGGRRTAGNGAAAGPAPGTGPTRSARPSASPSTSASPSPSGSVPASASRSAPASAAGRPAPAGRPNPRRGPGRRTPTYKWDTSYDEGAHHAPVLVGGTLWVAGALGRLVPTAASTGSPIGIFETGGNSVLPRPVAADGVVYIGAQLGRALHAIDGTTARRKWTFTAEAGVNSEAAVSDGGVFVNCFNGVLYGLNAATGTKRWSYRFGPASAFPCAAARGRIFVTEGESTDKPAFVRAVGARTGRTLWSGGTYDGTHAHPAVHGDTLIVSTWDVGLMAFAAADGTYRWTYRMKSPGVAGPVTVAGNTAYFGAPDGLHAVDARTGTKRWRADVGGVGRVAVVNGVVVTGGDSRLRGFDEASGAPLWQADLGGEVDDPLVADGVVYALSGGKKLTALTL